MIPEANGNANEIHQSPRYVAIRYEQIHEARIIPIDGSPHVGRAVQAYMGDARGRWDETASSSKRRKVDRSQQPFEYACHEGNYGLRNSLSTARALEERERR